MVKWVCPTTSVTHILGRIAVVRLAALSRRADDVHASSLHLALPPLLQPQREGGSLYRRARGSSANQQRRRDSPPSDKPKAARCRQQRPVSGRHTTRPAVKAAWWSD